MLTVNINSELRYEIWLQERDRAFSQTQWKEYQELKIIWKHMKRNIIFQIDRILSLLRLPF